MYQEEQMKQVKVFLTEEQHQRLQAEAERTGLKLSELLRRAIDQVFPPRQEPTR